MTDELRLARPDDVDGLAILLTELDYPTSGSQLQHRLGAWLDQSSRTLLVCESGPHLTGLLALTVTPHLERDGAWAQVVALVVGRDARRRGIGRRLLEHAEQLSRNAGCDAMIINSSRRRVEAHAFYERSGYSDRCGDHAQFFRTLPTAPAG